MSATATVLQPKPVVASPRKLALAGSDAAGSHLPASPPPTAPGSPAPSSRATSRATRERYAPPSSTFLEAHKREQLTPAIGLRFEREFQLKDVLALPAGDERRNATLEELAYLSASNSSCTFGGGRARESGALTSLPHPPRSQSRSTASAPSRLKTSRPRTLSSSPMLSGGRAARRRTRISTSTRPPRSARTAAPRSATSRTRPTRAGARSTSRTSAPSSRARASTPTSRASPLSLVVVALHALSS